MLKREFKFKDYDGNERTETHYFNLSKSELMEMELSIDGGYTNLLNRITDSPDGPELMRVFKELILKSYGIKSADGRRFEKSPEISKAFSETPAYDQLFMELISSADAAAKFVNGIGDLEQPKNDANANNQNNPKWQGNKKH